MTVRVGDSSALYAAFVASDAHHAKAAAGLAAKEPIVIPAEILAETMGLLQRRIGYAAALEAKGFLQSLPHVEVQPTWDDFYENILAEANRVFDTSKGQLSYPDAIVVAWCKMRKYKPFAFDHAILDAVKV